MEEKKISILFKRINLPSFAELKFVARKFSFKEKIIFLILFIAIIISALGILWTLNLKISIEVPKRGGSLTEGIIGTPNLINPLLSSSDADRDLSALIFSGLMRSDGKGGLAPNLAEKFNISEDGLSYTFFLKKDAVWQDGEKLTSKDIEFTIQTAKKPAIKSPVRANWEGVETEVIDDYTIRFWLKRPYAPFIENTTLGILPKHIWKDAEPEQFAFSEINRNPIGSGPYKVKSIEKNTLGIITSYKLEAFEHYTLGKPFVKTIKIRFYPNETSLISAYNSGEVNMISAISPQNIKSLNNKGVISTLTLPRVFAVFFNQNHSQTLAQAEVRKALNYAVDKKNILDQILMGYGTILNYPIPPGSFGTITEIDQNNNRNFSLESAKEVLENNKWKLNKETNILELLKRGEPPLQLKFNLTTSDNPDLVNTAQILRQMWQEMGAKVEVKIFEKGDLDKNIRSREYDALLFGEIVGRDPDPFAFWHSSQRNDPGLNIAMYANISVDKLLEEARTISNEEERKEKYMEFQEKISKDIPAVFLYSPYYIYVIPKNLKGIQTENITVPSERFANIHQWHLDTKYLWKIFAN